MTGIHINDTYGSIFGVDQLCECKHLDELYVGDTVLLETDSGPLNFDVTLIESYFDELGQPSNVMGVGLNGVGSEWIMPGDSLQVTETSNADNATTSFVHVPLATGKHIEIRRQLAAIGQVD